MTLRDAQVRRIRFCGPTSIDDGGDVLAEPVGLDRAMSAQQLADLIAYLRALASAAVKTRLSGVTHRDGLSNDRFGDQSLTAARRESAN